MFKEGKNLLLYSFIIRELPEKIKNQDFFYDIQPPYGYGCPVFNYKNKNFLVNARNEFCKWVKKNKILVEFIKFHPLVDPIIKDIWCTENDQLIFNRKVVTLNLKKRESFIKFPIKI